MLYLKIVPQEHAKDADREIKALSILDSPAFPRLYFSFKISGKYVLGMSYIRGRTLGSIVSKKKYISIDWVLNIGIQLCEILGLLHRCIGGPVYHLDIHPDNLIIFHDCLYIVDFGKSVCGEKRCLMTDRCGTLHFSAPELFEGGPVDARTDIYSAGGILLFLLEAVKDNKNTTAWECVYEAAMKCLRERPENRIHRAEDLKSILKEIEEEFF